MSMALTACDDSGAITDESDYSTVTSIYDKDANVFIELGHLDTISSLGYVVLVFEDMGPHVKLDPKMRAVISVFGISETPPKLVFDGKCYVLNVDFRNGAGLIEPVWTDKKSGKTICFDLLPDRGPKGN